MPMKKWIKTILLTIILAVVFHLIAIAVFPNAMMYAVLKVLMKGQQENTVYHRLPEAAGKDRVPMTSPNLLKSSCVFDVSGKPLRIKAAVPDTYWSLSLYAMNTDNFYVINDEQVKSKRVDIVLVGPGLSYKKSGDEEVVVAPSKRGYISIRMLITDPKRLPGLTKVQKQATFEPVQ
jgi:uncharacterized membrane protein